MTMNVDTYTELTPTAIAKMNFATSNHLPELDTSHMDSVDGLGWASTQTTLLEAGLIAQHEWCRKHTSYITVVLGSNLA